MNERYTTPTQVPSEPRRRWRVPFAIRVLLAALLASILAVAASYTLRTLNL